MELAIQSISNDQTLRSDTVQGLKVFNSQSSAKQAEKGDQLVSLMPAITKAFDLLGDDIVELYTEKDALKKTGAYDAKWLEGSNTKLLKLIDEAEKANLVLSRKQN